MKIIFSRLSNVSQSFKLDSYIEIEMAKLSNFLVQKHGFKTIFYGDETSIELFQEIPYDQILKIDNNYNNEISKKLWSIGKLLVMSQVKEPFIHMDYDLFLFKNFDYEFLKKNIIYFHNETYLDNKVDNYQKAFKLEPLNCKNFNNRSFNCAIIGGQNFQVLNMVSQEILNYIYDNKNEINKFLDYQNHEFSHFMAAVLIEQVWMFKLFQYYKENYFSYIEIDNTNIDINKPLKYIGLEAYTKNICHLQGAKKQQFILNNIIKMNKFLKI